MPQTAFVTGATGFLGRNLMDRLAAAGWEITALHRSADPPEAWAALPVTPVRGDVTDAAAVARAMPRGVEAVFHLAADTTPWRGARVRQEAVNIGGTEAVIAAARTANAGRLVHVSTCSVWGHHRGIVDETRRQRGRGSWVGYVRTKAEAEQRVRAAAADGLDAVVVNPAHILGRYDASNWSRLFFLIDRDVLPGVPPGGGCFANAGDVAEAMIAAAAHGRRGENYILGGPHASFLALVREIAGLLGKPAPRRASPAWLLKSVARIGDLKSRFTGRPPDLTPEAAYFVCHDERVSSGKAQAELGYRETPVARSLAQCHGWLVEEGLLPGAEASSLTATRS